MRIIMSAPWVYPFSLFGGMERYAFSLGKYLVKQGVKVKVITSRGMNEGRNNTYDGIDYEFIQPAVPVYTRYQWPFQYIFNFNLARHLAKERFDILHAFHITAFTYLHLGRRKPTIVQPFGLYLLPREKRNIIDKIAGKFLLMRPLAYCVAHADAVASEGDNQTGEIADTFHVPKSKFFALPDGVELDLISKYMSRTKISREDLRIQDADLVLINVNRLDLNKGVTFLIDALDMLNRELNTKLILVGSGPEEKRIKEKIRRLRLENKVIHFKDIPDEEKFQLHTLADISVTPTLGEGLPLVMLEAMATGKPVVATNITDIPGVINGNGIVVPPADAAAIADAILTIYRKGLIKSMARKSKQIIKNYDWNLIAQKAVQNYEEISKKGKLSKK